MYSLYNYQIADTAIVLSTRVWMNGSASRLLAPLLFCSSVIDLWRYFGALLLVESLLEQLACIPEMLRSSGYLRDFPRVVCPLCTASLQFARKTLIECLWPEKYRSPVLVSHTRLASSSRLLARCLHYMSRLIVNNPFIMYVHHEWSHRISVGLSRFSPCFIAVLSQVVVVPAE